MNQKIQKYQKNIKFAFTTLKYKEKFKIATEIKSLTEFDFFNVIFEQLF
jgi:hypothetical protein